tara:strand:- start:799 stop:1053 length:255 start_codon:yes stop_codon:yes gene_type:complete
MNSIKILVAPYIILLALLVHILTGDEIYLFIAGSLILLFLLIFFGIFIFILFRFGIHSVIETEIQPLPWMLFFLSLFVYIILKI